MPATLDDLTKTVESLKGQLDALDKPDTSKVKTDDEGRTVAAWDGDDSDFTLSEEHSSTAPRVKSHRRYISRRLKSIGYKPHSHFKSFGQFIRDGFDNPRGIEASVGDHLAKSLGLKSGEIAKTIQGMGEAVGSDGGVLVVPEYSSQIFDRVYANDIWGRTDSYTVSGNSMTFHANAETSRATGSRHGGLRGYWVGEGSTITSSKPTFRELPLKLRKLAIVVYLTEELLSDAAAAERYVIGKVDQEFNFMLGDAVFNGTGAGQPLGILNSPSLVSIAKETGQPAATLQAENVDKMWARRFAPGNFTWFHNQDVGPQLDQLSQSIGTSGVALYRDANGIASAAPQVLKSAARQETEFNSTLGTQGDLILADIGQYVSISKGGIAQAVSMHVEFLTDQTALRFTLRVDGQTWENSPITPFKGSNTQSSFVTLDTRA